MNLNENDAMFVNIVNDLVVHNIAINKKYVAAYIKYMPALKKSYSIKTNKEILDIIRNILYSNYKILLLKNIKLDKKDKKKNSKILSKTLINALTLKKGAYVSMNKDYAQKHNLNSSDELYHLFFSKE